MLRRVAGAVLAAGLAIAAVPDAASAQTFTLGDQDFVPGQSVGGVAGFNSASTGEPAPFDVFRGGDITGGQNFSASFTFNFAPIGSVTGASLTFGIFDLDAFLSGDQVASFLVGGADLTAALNALAEAAATSNGGIDVFTLALPASTFGAIASGALTASLSLQGGPGQISNGAGLDFARLTVNSTASTVPEPSTWALMATGLLTLGGVAARKRRTS
jgi:hypothetical protein